MARAETPAVQLPSFSADVQMINNGQVFGQGKFYMSPVGVRMEMNHGGMPMTVIDRLDKGVMWMLMGAQKTYMEEPLPFDPLVHRDIPPGWSQNCSPGEVIDNHPTDKCVLTGKVGDQTLTTTIWKAKDLNGVVIRNLGSQGAGMELKNVVAAPQPNSLFEPPSDFKKMNVPAAVQKMMKQKAGN